MFIYLGLYLVTIFGSLSLSIATNVQIYALRQYELYKVAPILRILDDNRNFLSPKYDFTQRTSDLPLYHQFSKNQCMNYDKNGSFTQF